MRLVVWVGVGVLVGAGVWVGVGVLVSVGVWVGVGVTVGEGEGVGVKVRVAVGTTPSSCGGVGGGGGAGSPQAAPGITASARTPMAKHLFNYLPTAFPILFSPVGAGRSSLNSKGLERGTAGHNCRPPKMVPVRRGMRTRGITRQRRKRGQRAVVHRRCRKSFGHRSVGKTLLMSYNQTSFHPPRRPATQVVLARGNGTLTVGPTSQGQARASHLWVGRRSAAFGSDATTRGSSSFG